MKNKNWVRVNETTHKWLSAPEVIAERGDFVSPDSETRWYAPAGKEFPLLCLTVYSNYVKNINGVLISTSYKDAADAWFADCALPVALLPELMDMLGKIK